MQDRVALVCAVDIYIYVCMFVCSGWGWWGWPHSLRRAPFLVHPSLLGSSSCWVNCCPKCFFHGRVWSASFRLHLTGNTLTCRRREGKERKKVSFGNRNDNHVADSPFPSPSHTHAQDRVWGDVWMQPHQLGINNAGVLHCVNVYVSLVAEHWNTWAILRPGALCKKSHNYVYLWGFCFHFVASSVKGAVQKKLTSNSLQFTIKGSNIAPLSKAH